MNENAVSFKFISPSFNEGFSSTQKNMIENKVDIKKLLIDLGIEIASNALIGVPVLGGALNNQVVQDILSDKVYDMIDDINSSQVKENDFKEVVSNAKNKFGIKIKSSKNSIQKENVNIKLSSIAVINNNKINKIISFFEELNIKMNELRDKVKKPEIIGRTNLNMNSIGLFNTSLVDNIKSMVNNGFSIIGIRLFDYDISKLKVPKNLKDPNKIELISEELLEMRRKQQEALKKKKEMDEKNNLELENIEELGSVKEKEYVPTLKSNNKPNAFVSVGVIYIVLGVIYTFIELMVLLYSFNN